MDRQQIVAEIKRLALENGGQPPGRQAFENATGAKMSEWYPHIWLRWGDALAEAGYAPNSLQEGRVTKSLYTDTSRSQGSWEDFRLRVSFVEKPERTRHFSHSAFERFGGKEKLLDAVAAYCQKAGGLDDILTLCGSRNGVPSHGTATRKREPKIPAEFVYLIKNRTHELGWSAQQ